MNFLFTTGKDSTPVLTPNEVEDIQDFVAQKFQVIDITEEHKGVPSGRYVHVGNIGQSINYLIRLLSDRKEILKENKDENNKVSTA